MLHEAFKQNSLDVQALFREYVTQPEFKRFFDEVETSLSARHQKSLSVLSLFAGEGKTFLVAALAAGYSLFLGNKVLVVDASRTRSDTSLLKALATSLTFGQDEDDYEGPQIDFITADSIAGGGKSPSDFRLRAAFASLGSSYDRIIVDTSALLEIEDRFVDPIIAAKQSGATIIVSSPYSLHRSSVFELRDQLNNSGVQIIGSVFMEGRR